jgi:hypothetical protein
MSPKSPEKTAHHRDIEALSSCRRNDHARQDLLSLQLEYDDIERYCGLQARDGSGMTIALDIGTKQFLALPWT